MKHCTACHGVTPEVYFIKRTRVGKWIPFAKRYQERFDTSGLCRPCALERAELRHKMELPK